MRLIFSMALGLTMMAGAAQAAGQLYNCDMTQRDKKVGWISPTVAVILPKNGKVQVYDSVILNFYGRPIAAKATKSGNTLRVSWKLKGLRDSNQQKVPQFEYVANINTKSNKVHLAANPVQFPNRWTARGTCELKTAK